MTQRTDTYDPELWQLVPRAPTPEMLDRLYVTPDVVGKHIVRHSVDKLPDAYKAMLAAAPTPPASTQSVECQHRIADARNAVVKSGYICVDCGAPFSAADHSGESAKSVDPVAFTSQERLDKIAAKGSHVDSIWGTYYMEHGDIPLYTAPPSAADVRDSALEEAAQKFDLSLLERNDRLRVGYVCDAIRALKSKKEA